MSRLVLLPGLAADERMYERLGAVGVPLVTPRLPVPAPGDDMESYARSVIRQLGLCPDDFLGGCSFGALVAAEVARQQGTRGLFLVAGALSSQTVSFPARVLGRLPRFLPLSLLRRVFASDRNLRYFFGGALRAYYPLAREMLEDTPDALLRQGARLAVTYRPQRRPECPVVAVHGRLDRIMAPPPVSDCVVVDSAAHGLAISHPQEVTEVLHRGIDRLGGTGKRELKV